MRPAKAEVYRIQMAVGGYKLDAYQDICSPAIGITDTKITSTVPFTMLTEVLATALAT